MSWLAETMVSAVFCRCRTVGLARRRGRRLPARCRRRRRARRRGRRCGRRAGRPAVRASDGVRLHARTFRASRWIAGPHSDSGHRAHSLVAPVPEAAPVPALDADRHVDLAHHDGLAVAHVAGIALDQIGAQVAAGGKARGIVEDAAVAAVGGVPGDVARPLRMRIDLVVHRQIAVAVDHGAEHHARVLGRGRLPGTAAARGRPSRESWCGTAADWCPAIST